MGFAHEQAAGGKITAINNSLIFTTVVFPSFPQRYGALGNASECFYSIAVCTLPRGPCASAILGCVARIRLQEHRDLTIAEREWSFFPSVQSRMINNRSAVSSGLILCRQKNNFSANWKLRGPPVLKIGLKPAPLLSPGESAAFAILLVKPKLEFNMLKPSGPKLG